MDSDVTVGDVITREYVGVSESDSVRDAVGLMREEQASSVIVLRGTDPVGIVTEYDVLGLVADSEDPAETPVSDVMSSPVRSVEADTRLVDAAGLMSGENIRNLLVEDFDDVVGVLTDRDIIAAVASLQRTATRRGAPDGATGDSDPAAGDPAAGAPGADGYESAATPAAGDAEYSTQGVCEVCGSLSEALHERNGRLVCSDCREL